MVPRINYLIFNSIFKVEGLRLQQYNTRNEDHEKQLLRLWKLLKPNEELEDRKSDQWQSIGFQGQLQVFLTFAPKADIAINAFISFNDSSYKYGNSNWEWIYDFINTFTMEV